MNCIIQPPFTLSNLQEPEICLSPKVNSTFRQDEELLNSILPKLLRQKKNIGLLSTETGGDKNLKDSLQVHHEVEIPEFQIEENNNEFFDDSMLLDDYVEPTDIPF